jgi:predicted ABC-type ATPase
MSPSSPRAIILAGPNGAGKTTAARTVLTETLRDITSVNADIIAQGLSGLAPESAAVEASRIMLEHLRELARQQADFAFETTLAARSYASWLQELRQTGYSLQLFYYWLNSADLAVTRVALRVSQGGHGIPEPIVRQRYVRSIQNFFSLYRNLVHSWQVFDNSEIGFSRLIAVGGEDLQEEIVDRDAWERMQKSLNDV